MYASNQYLYPSNNSLINKAAFTLMSCYSDVYRLFLEIHMNITWFIHVIIIYLRQKKNIMESTTIKCPHCAGLINVNELLYSQMHESLSQEFNAKLSLEKQALERDNIQLNKERSVLQKQKLELESAIASGITKKLAVERSKLEKSLRDMLADEKSEELNSYKQQLEEKSQELKAHNKLKAENQRLQLEKSEMKGKIEAEAEERITNLVELERKRIRKEAEQKNELKVAEKEHIIQQLKNQLVAAQQKAEQGSGQLRGEVLEIGMEDHLRENFPLDTIEEIKKGVKGADCLHIVRSLQQHSCGSIYYETKRTKEFHNSWIAKFKDDMRARGADVGVLVTETYPAGTERISMKDGIWICSYEEAKGLCHVLRQSMIMLSEAKAAQADKGGKMEILYEYMISNEFRMQIEAIVEGFTEMQSNLHRERRAMEGIWKERQKQIEKVLLNTSHIYSSVRDIAGKVISPIRQLELEQSSLTNTKSHKLISPVKPSKNGSSSSSLPRKK